VYASVISFHDHFGMHEKEAQQVVDQLTLSLYEMPGFKSVKLLSPVSEQYTRARTIVSYWQSLDDARAGSERIDQRIRAIRAGSQARVVETKYRHIMGSSYESYLP
jgi:heme-degrading monooxygenase HmoA